MSMGKWDREQRLRLLRSVGVGLVLYTTDELAVLRSLRAAANAIRKAQVPPAPPWIGRQK